jgi:hypothetical protein
MSCLALHLIQFGIDKAHMWKDSNINPDIADFIESKLKATPNFPLGVRLYLNKGINDLRVAN